MRPRRLHLIARVSLAAFCSCAGDSGDPQPPRQELELPAVATQAPEPTTGDPEPQDLEPVETRKSYGARDPDPLLKDVDAAFSMVSMPSFTPAYAIALVIEEPEDAPSKASPVGYSIHFAADEPGKSRRLAKGEDPRRAASATIDQESARRLMDAWESVVRRARYPRPRYTEGPNGERWESRRMGMDGTTYRFECGEYCGTTWEPRAELTWGITELGEELRKYALIEEKAQPEQLARCLELAKKLQTAAEKRPW